MSPSLTIWQLTSASLALNPHSPVTDKIFLYIRGAVENNGGSDQQYKLSLYLDRESGTTLLHSEVVKIAAHSNASIFYRHSTESWIGGHRVLLVAASRGGKIRARRDLQVVDSKVRSTGTIDGAWVDIAHRSDEEGRQWN